jgi:hypothetical protein
VASLERTRSLDRIPMRDRRDRDGVVTVEDPAACAERVVGDEVMSILQAVEARTSEIDATARREADEIRRGADRAGARAVARLRAIARELDALADDLDHAARDPGARDGRGE